jgi:hypothetical protein
MDVFSAIFQLICLLLGSAEKAQYNECLKTHTQQECEQNWRGK